MAKICLLLQLLIVSGLLYAQTKVEWQVVDQYDNPLVGATIRTHTGNILITDQAGVAISPVRDSLLIFSVSYMGFESVTDTVISGGDRKLVVQMVPKDVLISEVVVTGDKLKDQLTEAPGLISFGVESVADLPYLLGEQDPVKFIQTQTGVSSGTDGNNGYYVRGGGIDQNMIVLDRMELYNTNHLFGFFSTFNANAIDRVDFLKSGYPAHVGGRLSSVMSIHTKTPRKDRLSGSLGLGVLALKANLEVPVIKGNSALLVSIRKSYIDLITQNILPDDNDFKRRTNYAFSDIVLKYDHQFGQKHWFSLTGFSGSDDYDFQSNRSFANQIRWKSYNLGGVWKWLISSTSDAEIYFNTGFYDQVFLTGISNYKIDLKSDISSWKAGAVFSRTFGGHEWTFSGTLIKRFFQPTQAKVNSGAEEIVLSDPLLMPTVEGGISLGDQVAVSDQLRMTFGLRVSAFWQLGPFSRYKTTDNNVIEDTLVYADGKVAARYLNPEPRFQIVYLLNPNTSLKMAYDRSFQYIHLSPLSSVSLPTDIWVPSSSLIRPQNAHQLTVGYFRVLGSPDLKVSAEAFFKLLDHQLEYRNGAIAGYSDSKNFDDDFIFGKGRSFGIELSAQRKSDVFSYQLNYTLGKTERIFNGINGDGPFPAKYDRRHDLNVVLSYNLGNWSFSSLFKFSTGNALTLPVSKYVINERVVSEYSSRNAFRMPAYHRLDMAASLHPKGKENVTWSFSVYNAYNRKNPYFVYFDVQGDVSEYSLDIDLKKVSLFPILPSLGYEYKF